MIDVFTPKGVLLIISLKATMDIGQVKNSILFPQCEIYPCGMLHTAVIVSVVCKEIISAVCCTPRRSSPRYNAHRGDHFVIEYLGEIETEFENTLGYLSGAQMCSNHE